MMFVPADELKVGMRLAKPIFNKRGVLLYDRDTKLTAQGITSIRNFNLIGIYVLEPAEPLPPMTEEDREFERFQTMSVFTLQEIMNDIRDGRQPAKLEQLCTDVLRHFGRGSGKFTFMQNLRSPEDTVYKHSLNTAILSAAIYAALAPESKTQQRYTVMAALLHDIGSLEIPDALARKKAAELTEDDLELIALKREEGYRMIRENCDLESEVMKDISYLLRELRDMNGMPDAKTPDYQVETLKCAYVFDQLTAMKYGEEPQSDIAAYKYLHHPAHHINQQVVAALAKAVKIVPAGCSVVFTDGTKGIVLTENPEDILRPFVLSYKDNQIYNLSDGKVYEKMQISDVLKTMDNRYIMTDEYKKYQEALKNGEEKVIRRPGRNDGE